MTQRKRASKGGTEKGSSRRKAERSSDAFRRASEIRERIAARTGDIDTRELLDAVRGPWGEATA